MNVEIKAAWIKAMLSDVYRRGTAWLARRIDGIETHCPFGVLCDLAEKAGVLGAGAGRS